MGGVAKAQLARGAVPVGPEADQGLADHPEALASAAGERLLPH